MARAITTGNEWITTVLKKLGIDHTRVSRLVIDCDVNAPIMLYITYYGGEELLEVRPPEANEVVIKELGK